MDKLIGRVHSIETFSTLDGPGIRTVIFMQGCHLRCKYCHNPDTWELKSFNMREYTPLELMDIIRRSKPYFNASGGGITFSGGEPLLHDEFIKYVFSLCQAENIATAFDSSLFVNPKSVLNVLPFTDLVLADIKHMDDDKSRCLTGLGNKMNLKNLILINQHEIPIWVRYVVVPGWTDKTNDVREMARFIAKLEMVERVELLPYHALGKHKWDLLGYEYELQGIEPPISSELESLQAMIAEICSKPVYMT
ncbi:MAG: pyruvate formate-lyase-activating protein [Syntrophomonas sp.]